MIYFNLPTQCCPSSAWISPSGQARQEKVKSSWFCTEISFSAHGLHVSWSGIYPPLHSHAFLLHVFLFSTAMQSVLLTHSERIVIKFRKQFTMMEFTNFIIFGKLILVNDTSNLHMIDVFFKWKEIAEIVIILMQLTNTNIFDSVTDTFITSTMGIFSTLWKAGKTNIIVLFSKVSTFSD